MAGTARYKRIFFLFCILMLAFLCTSCEEMEGSVDESISMAELRANPLFSELQKLVDIPLPEASGTVVYQKKSVTVDASHTNLGYIMVKSEQNPKRLKLRLSTKDGTYTYDLHANAQYETFPLQMGDGAYTLSVFENLEGDLYGTLLVFEFDVKLTDAMMPYLYPSQYVNYDAGSDAVLYSQYLCLGTGSDEARRSALYRYVAKHISYDQQKADTVKSGYLPDVDDTLNTHKGICFDYSALLACMLRSKNIPTKLVVGYVGPGDMLHAWNMAFVDGKWVWMDATLDGENKKESDYTEQSNY